MSERRNIKYFFSVEGETESLYLEHLKQLILVQDLRIANPVIRVEKHSPLKVVKKLSLLQSCIITSVFDVEDDTNHKQHFENILKEMKQAEKLGKSIKYELAYSNIDFELWIILHKKDLFGSIYSKNQYLPHINSIFGTKFESLKEYKEEKNFSQILSKITLDDVKEAIIRAEKIMNQRKLEASLLKSYGYEWCDKNPSLSIHNVISKILKECGV